MSSKKISAVAVNPFRLAELRSIVGPKLEDNALVRLLNRANGVVERAVNFYLDSDGVSASSQSSDNSRKRNLSDGRNDCFEDSPCAVNVPVEGCECVDTKTSEPILNIDRDEASCDSESMKPKMNWPKFVGTIQVIAYTTMDICTSKLPEGCKVFISRRSPAAETEPATVAPKRIKKLGVGSSRKLLKRDFILRWGVGSEEYGRLPSEISKPLAILLDSDWLELEGCMLSSLNSVKKFSNVPLSLNIYIKEFSSVETADCDAESPDSADEALKRVLNILRYTPKIPSEIMSSALGLDQEKAGNGPASKMCEAKVDAIDEGGSLSREHVDILFAETDKDHDWLPEQHQPPAMITKLRDYQLQVECYSLRFPALHRSLPRAVPPFLFSSLPPSLIRC